LDESQFPCSGLNAFFAQFCPFPRSPDFLTFWCVAVIGPGVAKGASGASTHPERWLF